MRPLLRYMRLFAYFVRFSFSKAMEFRVDFFFRVAMDICFYTVNILFFDVLFQHTDVLVGWDLNQIRVFIGGFLIVDAISMTLFSNNLWFLSTYVNRGDLDYYLIRPVSSLFMVSLRDFAANSFMNLLIAIGVLVWALSGYEGEITFLSLGLYIILLLNGVYLRYCVRMMTILPVFWLHSSQGFEFAFFHMARFVERPDKIFTGVTRVLLTTVLPFSLIVSFPAGLFIDGFDLLLFGWIAGITGLFSIALSFLWRRGLMAYSSASS